MPCKPRATRSGDGYWVTHAERKTLKRQSLFLEVLDTSVKKLSFLPGAIFWYLLANHAHKSKSAPLTASHAHLPVLDHKPLKGRNQILLAFYNGKQQQDWFKSAYHVWQHCAWWEFPCNQLCYLRKAS